MRTVQDGLRCQSTRSRGWSTRACTASLLLVGAWLVLSAHLGLHYSRTKSAGSSTARLKPHTVSPRLAVPPNIQRPPYVDTGENPWSDEPQIHDAEVSMQASVLIASKHGQTAVPLAFHPLLSGDGMHAGH